MQNEDDLLLSCEGEGDHFLHTPRSEELQDCLLLSDDDSGTQLSLYQNENPDVPTATDLNPTETSTTPTGQYPIGQTDQVQGHEVESMPSGFEKIGFGETRSARELLNERSTPSQYIFADLIDDYYDICRPKLILTDSSPYVEALLEGPNQDDINELRRDLFHRRICEKKYQLWRLHWTDKEDIENLSRFWRRKEKEGFSSFLNPDVYATMYGLADDDALRVAILTWKQSRKEPTDYNYGSHGEPEISDQTRCILNIDHIMGRASTKEIDEAERRCQGLSAELSLKLCKAIVEKRFSPNLQRRRISQAEYDERRRCYVQPRKPEMGEDAKRKMSHADTWDSDEEPEQVRDKCGPVRWYYNAAFEGDKDCCAECAQCKSLEAQGEPFKVEAHHVVLVRIVIKHIDEYLQERRHFKDFRLQAISTHDENNKHTDRSGIEPYWKYRHFYDRLRAETKQQVRGIWPFSEFRDAGVAYRLKPRYVTYDSFENGETIQQKIAFHEMTADSLNNAGQPKHITQSHSFNRKRPTKKLEYNGLFIMHMDVTTNADKAKEQRILYADDRFGQRLKQIMNEDGRNRDPLYTVGSLLLAMAARRTDGFEDRVKPKYPPYPKASMKETMDKTSWDEYTTLNNRYRKEDLEAQQKCGKANLTSSTRGHQADAEPLDTSPNGTDIIPTTPSKDTNKKSEKKEGKIVKSSMASTVIHCSSKPALPEKSWSNSTRTWNTAPSNYSHTAKSRPLSRDGYRGSSSAPVRKSVFDRLTESSKYKDKTDKPRKKDDDEHRDKAKKSKLSKSKRR